MDVRSVSATAITTATASVAKNGSLKDLLAVLTCYAAIEKKIFVSACEYQIGCSSGYTVF